MATEPGLSRRTLLGAALAMGLAPAAQAGDAGAPLLSAWDERRPAGRAYFAGPLGGRAIPLPERAHQVVADPLHPGRGWAVARRPGEWLWRLDLRLARAAGAVALDDLRRFEGHVLPWVQGGVVGTLFDTESSTEDGTGRVALRDPGTLALRAEFDTFGIGPHELRRWNDDALVVANGGLLVLPETGRTVLNPLQVRSDVVCLDARDGRLRERWAAPAAGLSLRHVARASDGTLGVAMQAVDEADAVPLLALGRRGGTTLVPAESDEALNRRLRGYAGAVAAAGNNFALSCPRGHRVVVWASSGRRLAEIELPGPCGLVARGAGWWVTGSDGGLYEIDSDGLHWRLLSRNAGRVWDNHIG